MLVRRRLESPHVTRNSVMTMKSGLYAVIFNASHGNGGGVVSFEDGTLNGGDAGYYYQGTYREEAGKVTASLRVRRWNPAIQSVFGDLAEIELNLHGTAEGEVFTAGDGRISVSGRRIADLL